MSPYIITTLCTVLWYMCVLLTWVYVNQSLKLFADHSPHGWLMIFLAFVGSLAVNFIMNPLLWVSAGCYIHTARKEGKSSKWEFYPVLVGVLLLALVLASVFMHVKIPAQLFRPQEGAAPAPRFDDGPPEISGIMFSDEPKVLIDGHVFKVGDEVNGYEIWEIKEDAVVFVGPDGTETVRRVK